jgi:hypothetical protein
VDNNTGLTLTNLIVALDLPAGIDATLLYTDPEDRTGTDLAGTGLPEPHGGTPMPGACVCTLTWKSAQWTRH